MLYDIPGSFKVADHTYYVEIKDFVYDENNESCYGIHDHGACTIEIAKKLKYKNYDIDLTDTQILNSFFHELVHVFQFFYDNQSDEAQAQSFANMIYSYVTTKKQDGEDS